MALRLPFLLLSIQLGRIVALIYGESSKAHKDVRALIWRIARMQSDKPETAANFKFTLQFAGGVTVLPSWLRPTPQPRIAAG